MKNNISINTPAYFYNIDLLRLTLEMLSNTAGRYDYKVHYALKANYNPEILSIISGYGLGADCVSGNEIKRALETGFESDSIAFAGVGKTDQEIVFALNNGIFSLNCESLQELEVVNHHAGNLGVKAPVFLRINPDVEVDTHHYITTGKAENKFGMNESVGLQILAEKNNYPHIDFKGLHFHIGSQINDLEPFKNLCLKINEVQKRLQKMGIRLKGINVGGGLGIDYDHPQQNPIPDFASFFRIFHDNLILDADQKVHFELGRSVVGQCGTLLSKVLYIKEGPSKKFAVIDAGMTDLLRPALYNAYHKIENLSNTNTNSKVYDVVGPVCESSDTFGRNVSLCETRRGDLMAIYSVGAYGQVMTSQYNLRSPAQTIYSNDIGITEVKELVNSNESTG